MQVSEADMRAAFKRFSLGYGVHLVNCAADWAGPVKYEDDGWARLSIARYLREAPTPDFRGLARGQAFAPGVAPLVGANWSSTAGVVLPTTPAPASTIPPLATIYAPLITVTFAAPPVPEASSIATLDYSGAASTFSGVVVPPGNVMADLSVLGFDETLLAIGRRLRLSLFTESSSRPAVVMLWGLPVLTTSGGADQGVLPPSLTARGHTPVIRQPSGDAFSDPVIGFPQTAWGRQLRVNARYQARLPGVGPSSPIGFSVNIGRPIGLGSPDDLCGPADPCDPTQGPDTISMPPPDDGPASWAAGQGTKL